MKYVGSKNKLRKELIPIIQSYINNHNINIYIEPFVGGANVIDKIKCHNKIGIDTHKYLVALLNHIKNNRIIIRTITENQYKDVRLNKQNYDDWFVGLVGFCATYGAKWFGGYARGFKADKKTPRNHSNESIRNLEKQIPNLKDINFINGDFELSDEYTYSKSLIYCDIPYKDSTKYGGNKSFDYDRFYNWCRKKVNQGHIILVSEYNMPNGFKCIWSKEHKTTLQTVQHSERLERLFILENNLGGNRMTPKEKREQIENGDNWIVEFWRKRGYEEVKTAMGISFSLHRKNPRYECLGLDLLHLEMFRDEVIKKVISDLEDWNNSENIHLGDAINRLNNRIIEQKKAFSEEVKKHLQNNKEGGDGVHSSQS